MCRTVTLRTAGWDSRALASGRKSDCAGLRSLLVYPGPVCSNTGHMRTAAQAAPTSLRHHVTVALPITSCRCKSKFKRRDEQLKGTAEASSIGKGGTHTPLILRNRALQSAEAPCIMPVMSQSAAVFIWSKCFRHAQKVQQPQPASSATASNLLKARPKY